MSECPNGYKPTNMTNDLSTYHDSSSICLENGKPLLINDLAGLQISADNGTSVYLVISNIPMDKLNITHQNYNTNIWLPVSRSVLDNLTTVAAMPKVTTEVGTIGDAVSTFKILQINQTMLKGNVTEEYPVCCSYSTRIIQVGDDIGVKCLGVSEVLSIIDYQHNLAVFTKNTFEAPSGTCPTWTEDSTSQT